MCAVQEKENRAGRTVVYCLGETGAKVMDRAVLKRDRLPNNAEWFCIRCGPIGRGSAEMIRRDFEDKEYLLLLFDLRDGYDDMRNKHDDRSNEAGDPRFYLAAQIAGFIASIARGQGLKIFSAVTVGDRMGGGETSRLLSETLLSIGETSDCILTLSYPSEQHPEEPLWQAAQLLLSMTVPRFVSLNLADVRKMFPNGGRAYLGAGHADGADLVKAAGELLSSCEFTEQLKQAGGLCIHISCPEAGLDSRGIEQATRPLYAIAPPDADIIWSVRPEEVPQAGTHIIVLASDRLNRAFKPCQTENAKKKRSTTAAPAIFTRTAWSAKR